jgi:hypothetical protein
LDRTEYNNLNIQNNTYFPFCPILVLFCLLRLLFSVLSNIGVVLYVYQYWTERKIIIKTYKTTPILDRTENNNQNIQSNTNIGQNGKYFPFCPILVLFCMLRLLFSVLSNIGVVLYVKIIIFRSVQYWCCFVCFEITLLKWIYVLFAPPAPKKKNAMASSVSVWQHNIDISCTSKK